MNTFKNITALLPVVSLLALGACNPAEVPETALEPASVTAPEPRVVVQPAPAPRTVVVERAPEPREHLDRLRARLGELTRDVLIYEP